MMRYLRDMTLCLTAILLSVLLSWCGSLSAQPYTRNYVKTVTMLDEESANSITEFQYYDLLGRPDLTATNGLGENGRYAYSVVEYNEAGLVMTEFPVSADDSSNPDTPSANSVRGMGQSTYGDQKPYTVKQYDALGRLVYSCGPGKEWHNQNKHVSVSYGVNSANSVKIYTSPTSGNSLVKTGKYYPAGTLRVETTTDEDGSQLQVFTDRLGRKVLERRGTDNDTYFVYNDFGQLRFVLSPQYQQQGDKAPFAYEYRYDEKGRMVKKILPGCEYIQYWYDKGDRLMFMQDARLRAESRYRFYFYDRHGRLAIQGLCKTCHRGDYYGFVYPDFYEEGLCGTGYFTTKGNAVSGPLELELCNYYDDYSFLRNTLLTGSGHKTELTRENSSTAYGQLTGHVSRLSDGTLSYQTHYYDDKGQPIDTRTTFPDGRVLTEQTTYSFTGNPLTVRQELRQGGSIVKSVTQTSTYGIHNDMLKTVSLTVGSGTPQTVATYTYDGVGRRTAVQRGGTAGTVNYAYNVRNWMTAISSPDLTERLYYTDGPGTACYGGNVSSMTWKTSNETVTRGYRLSYDNLSRLTNAAYGEGSDISGNAGRYDEKVVTYNRNGAPTRLQRSGKKQNGTYGLVDDLSLAYDGNRLQQVSDAAPAVLYSGNFGFTDNTVSTTGVEYGYDGCGSLVWDANKGVSHIGYDLHGMPRHIQFSAGHTTEYVYDADGRKLRTVHRTAVPNMSVPLNSTVELDATNTLGKDSTDYVGSFILRQGQLDKYLFDGGYVTFSGSTPQFHYYGKDHLGNNRTVVNSNGTLEQVTHYYPFGGVFGDVSLNASTQEYKYNGKELDHTHGLDWYDYGARNYDAALWQWNGVDMLAEKYPHISPYSYCGNNPIDNIDVDGNDYWSTNDKDLIIDFINALGSGQTQFDFSRWNHATDAEITGNLTYNDETRKFYTSYTKVVDGEINVIGRSFDANITPVSYSGAGYLGAFVYQPVNGFWETLNYFLERSTYFDGAIKWDVNTSGRIIGVKPIIGVAPVFGKGKIWNGKQKMGRAIGKMSGNHDVQNKQIRDLARKHKLNNNEIEELHELIHEEGYNYHEIEELIINFFNK